MTSQLQSLIPSITFLSPKPSPTFLSPKPSFPPPPPLLRLSLTPKPTPFRLVATRARAKPKSPSGEQKWTHEGSVTESLPNGMFRVLLDNNDLIIGYISGKIRKNFVRILPGDRVKVEVSRYDTSRGRIVYRHRTGAKDLNAD